MGNMEKTSSHDCRRSELILGFMSVVSDDQFGFVGGYLLVNATGRPLEFHCTVPVKPTRAQEILYGPTLRPYLFGEQIGRSLFDHAKAKPQLVCVDLRDLLTLADCVRAPVALVATKPGDAPAPRTAPQADSVGQPHSGEKPGENTPARHPGNNGNGGACGTFFTSDSPPVGASTSAGSAAAGIALMTPPTASPQETASSQEVVQPRSASAEGCVVTVGRNRLLLPADKADSAPAVREILAPWSDVLDLAEPFGRIREAIEEARRGH